MDEELLELQRQFEFAQQAKSKVRLSERNVVELIQKLHELQIIDYDLLHTVSGKEYITPDQLKHEIEVEVRKSGRVSLIDLSDTIGMDLYHVERLSHQVVMEDSGLMLTQGEIISQTYWDNIAEEINERLQECSQISLAELASQLQVGSELLTAVLETRLGSIVKGRFESGQLYTPLYVARVNAMVRGAARGITVPTNLTMLWSSLQQILQETNGGSGISAEGGFFQSLFNGLLKEGEILGSLRAGVHWTPSVFAHAQRECVDSFFSQNSFITYDILQRLAIPQPRQHLEFRYPKGIPLVTVFIHPSIIEMLDAAVEDAIKHNSWIDCLSVLPTSFGSQDVSKLLSYCPAVQKSIKSSLAIILGESFVFSSNFLKDLFDYLEKELEGFYLASTSSQGSHEDMNLIVPVGHNSSSKVVRPESIDDGNSDKTSLQKNSKKRREKLLESSKVAAENYIDKEEFQTKIKKNLKKVSDKKASSKKDNSKINEENPQDIDEEWIAQKILIRSSDLGDFAGQDNSNALLDQLVAHVRPMLLNKWKERKNKLFVENSEKRRKLLDNLQRKLDEAFFNLQLHEKALDLFEDDPSISFILHKHVLRNTASSIVDLLIKNLDTHNKLMNGVEVTESEEQESSLLNPTDRMSLAKNFPISLSKKVTSCVEALEGKRVDSFINSLKDLADESGLILRKLDKKLERTLLHSFRKELISRVSTETDPTLLLPLVVSLFYLKVHNKILQAPGRAISVAISRLKGKLDDSVYEVLANYHTLTVSLLSLLASGTHDEEGCTTDKIQSKRELLESEMSKLKDLVFGS